MTPFARLLDALLFAPQRSVKLRLLADYFRAAPDPDRGYALAALTGTLSLAAAKPATVRALVAERVDPVLFGWSYDFVGDLAETVSLIWPEPGTQQGGAPRLAEIVETLGSLQRARVQQALAGWLDRLDATGRWALLKLVTGAMRVGVSARLAKTALAEIGAMDPDAIEEVWHGLAPPYATLFAWVEGRGPRPEIGDAIALKPPMLAHPIEDDAVGALDPAAYRAEWKWDGIRVQVAGRGGRARLFSRTGDDIGAAFPDVVEAIDFDAVLDGELLIARVPDGKLFDPRGPFPAVAPFSDLQQRLNRKRVTAQILLDRPAFVRLYDLLAADGEDLRPMPFDARRARLEAWMRGGERRRFDLSPLVPFASFAELDALRRSARAAGIEGLMLKRADSAYLPGRPVGPWYKWKRGPLVADCVLMYAQRGHGKRSSFYSDYTFGCWRDAELVPVGKAYSGFTDDELRRIDAWVRANTVDRFGPVRVVRAGLVFEVAFDSVQASSRHKSGLAMRFPRIHRIRWDKPAAEADRVEGLAALVAD
ncbi:MAG: cisplatin damage response ATP-dependent DNA ligase [Alphaproteobacteria bacterium]|nr:cisplatin damage response ATP-dependent DNA ligase [Alphaproteobacteria bacterium]